MASDDLYERIGVGRSATQDEIKKAYRALAKKYHPDRNPGNAQAEETLKGINEAYEVLSDPEKRANYDRYGTADFQGIDMGGFGVIDLLSQKWCAIFHAKEISMPKISANTCPSCLLGSSGSKRELC